MRGERIPCVNPSCRRTAAQERFPDSSEIICGKCFRALPISLRRAQKAVWRRHRKLDRLQLRKDMVGRQAQIARARSLLDKQGQRTWWAIYRFFMPQEKPAGLDAFLEEVGL